MQPFSNTQNPAVVIRKNSRGIDAFSYDQFDYQYDNLNFHGLTIARLEDLLDEKRAEDRVFANFMLHVSSRTGVDRGGGGGGGGGGGREVCRGRYHGGRRPSSDDSFHSPTVIPPSALDKPSIMKRYHRRRTCSHTSPRRSPTMVTLHNTRFVKCRWRNDGWTAKTVVT